jgi:serine/threonine protein phosphatase PrpC
MMMMISPVSLPDLEARHTAPLIGVADRFPTIARKAGLTMTSGAFTEASHGSVLEDAFLISPDNAAFVVASGQGRGKRAQAAAEITVQQFRNTLGNLQDSPRHSLRTLIKKALTFANTEMIQQSRESRQRLQSSLVVAMRYDSSVLVKSVGNCRAYLLRHQNLKQLTRDHSLGQFLSTAGRPASTSSHGSVQPDILLNHLGRHDFQPNDEFNSIELGDGDRLMLCSKGLTSVLSHAEIERILNHSWTAVDAATSLGRAAVKCTPSNDVTCVTVFAEANDSA